MVSPYGLAWEEAETIPSFYLTRLLCESDVRALSHIVPGLPKVTMPEDVVFLHCNRDRT